MLHRFTEKWSCDLSPYSELWKSLQTIVKWQSANMLLYELLLKSCTIVFTTDAFYCGVICNQNQRYILALLQ